MRWTRFHREKRNGYNNNRDRWMFDKTTLSILILRSTSYLHQIHDTTLFNNNLIQQLIHTNAMAYHTMQITNQSSGREERMIMLIIIFISQHKTFTHIHTHTDGNTHGISTNWMVSGLASQNRSHVLAVLSHIYRITLPSSIDFINIQEIKRRIWFYLLL